MLAAVTEIVMDRPLWTRDPVREAMLSAAQAHWLDDAVELNSPLDRSGVLLPATAPGEAESTAHQFRDFSDVRLLNGKQARARQPWLGESVNAAVFVPQDWRLDAPAALTALSTIVQQGGGELHHEPLPSAAFAQGRVVIAAGYQARGFNLPELTCLTPIKGQLVKLTGGPTSGATIRTPGAYIVPQVGGAIVGATMEEGRDDTAVEPEAIRRLVAAAEAVMPGLRASPAEGLAGVRAATPDGLPLVGPSSREGVYLAVGARRNGWLLAPLVGRMVAAYLTGDDPGPYAARLDPRRFDR